MAKKSVAVRIAGHEYKILTEGDAKALRQIAGDVDRAMKRVQERTGTVDTLDIAVLTCLNLAREVIDLRSQMNGAVSDERMRDLIDRVEGLIGERAEFSESASGLVAAAEVISQAPEQHEPARTLDLSSFEALRERATQDSAIEESDEPRRVAAGGSERAS